MATSAASVAPRVGCHAPALVGERAAHGEPRVIAFVADAVDDAIDDVPGDALARIRAQLRGLGAALVVLSPRGAWWLGPDDAIAPLGEAADDVAAAAARYEVAGDAVFVVDGRGIVRFAHRGSRLTPGWQALAGALAIAGDAMHARDEHDARQRLLFTRREWTATCLVIGCATALLAGCKEQARKPPERQPAGGDDPPDLDVALSINGKLHKLRIDPRASLLDTLRERLGLTGSKKGCDAGQCGACTVLIDGKRVASCLTLAVMAQGREVTTIEGLAKGGVLHPMQQAFVEHDGLQCGYCTPGQILSAIALLAEQRATTDAEVREQMSGNLCRCGAYPNIVAAIQAARRRG